MSESFQTSRPPRWSRGVVILAVVALALAGPSNALAEKMYWALDPFPPPPVGDPGEIQRADFDGSNVETLVTGLVSPTCIALDMTNEKMYWTEFFGDRIQRANLDGSDATTVVLGLDRPVGIALDLPEGKMYWSNFEGGSIQRSNLDGTAMEPVITGLESPAGVTLDLANDHIYWCDSDGSIRRADLDGSDHVVLVAGRVGPNKVELDLDAGLMYWSDDGEGILRSDLSGQGILLLVEGSFIGLALDLQTSKMYWTDDVAGKIQRANLDGTNVEDLVTDLNTPLGIALELPACGDGVLDPGEECDDGNNDDGDGCAADCTIEEPDVPATNAIGTILLVLALGGGTAYFMRRRKTT